MIQLGLFEFVDDHKKAVVIAKTPTHSITHTPNNGYKVVMAPGLTSAGPRNPCRTCQVFGKDMDSCFKNCLHADARFLYLKSIGESDHTAVDTEGGSYGVGY
jgi:hypothetical protein